MKMLSTEALSKMLDVPVGTLHQWASRGTGPRFYRVGRHRRYAEADVHSWLEKRASDRPAA
jgi:excisionase family DNA binding protein